MADEKLTDLTAIGASLSVDDLMYIVHDPAGTPVSRKVALSDLLKIIDLFTEDTAPDPAADFLLSYDATASAVKKILLNKAFRFRLGSTTRDLTTATGTASLSSFGFRPRLVLLLAGVVSSAKNSFGWSDGSNNQAFYNNHGVVANTWATIGSLCFFMEQGGSNQHFATITLDADGFTFNFTKVGSPTGTADIYYLAIA